MAGPNNWYQKWQTNPITTNVAGDLLYFARSPYGATNDAVIDWNSFIAQFAAPYTPAALTKTNDTNVTLTLGGTPATSLLQAVSLTLGWTGQLSLAKGGSNANLTASNGGIFYSTASAGAILAGTATANQILLSGSSGAPAWSTATYPATAGTSGNVLTSDGTNWSSQAPGITMILTTKGDLLSFTTTDARLPVGSTNGQILQVLSSASQGLAYSTATYPATTTINQVLYSSSANVIGGVSAVNSAVMISSSGGVPSFSTTLPSGLTIPGYQASLTLPLVVGQGGTGNTTFTAYSVICAGTTATGVFQNVSGVGSSGQVLTSNGAAALPTWQAAGGGGPWSAGAGTGSGIGGDGTNTAAGNYALSYGNASNKSAGTSSVAFGRGNTSNGNYSVCIGEGNETTSGGVCGVALGMSASVIGQCGVAIGNNVTSNNAGSFVFADNTASNNSDAAANQFVSTFANGHLFYTGSSQPAFQILGSASAVNYISITNNSTGNPPVFNARGSDTNIDLNIGGKGTGAVNILGASTNSSASAGYVGEYISSSVLVGSAVSVSSGTPKTITSISLTAGDWDVSGSVATNPATGTITAFCIGAINTTTNALPTIGAENNQQVAFNPSVANANYVVSAGPMRISVASTTPVYLVIDVSFSISTMTAYGFIGARRRR